MSTTPEGYSPAQVAGLGFSYPSEWQRVDQPEADLVLAWPEGKVEGFRPNLVITSEATDMSIQRLSTRAMATVLAAHTGSYLIACDLWGVDPVPARRIGFTYTASGSTINVEKYLFRIGGQAVDFTFSCGVRQYYSLEPLFGYIARTIRPAEVAA
ncbi:hypothetical protein D477_019056 [Arthrobacter crystallopoietes BAB-32]|uniref:Uncharacterized protein n=1 Tax=Arthrobacter crystallopoietes BAB-32 TaxID=1246476 RepID=N1UY01_9MICC|nr:hypothetical protein [Arthrobacter crystallopoietes]EMY32659.1 hypothetical protein D477_019056 [Arthrobacter crystallopoietes BAB-32]